MLRFVRWLRAELEMQGVLCYVADRSRCKSTRGHGVARAAMDAAAVGVVVVTARTFSSTYSMEEIRMFIERKKMVPIFFELSQEACNTRDIVERRGEVWERYGGEAWERYGGLEDEWRETVNGLSKLEVKLEAHGGNFRDCISEVLMISASELGRRSVVKRLKSWKELGVEEFPFPRNTNFVGRKKELLELEYLLFGYVEGEKENGSFADRTYRMYREEKTEARGSVERSRKGKEPMIWKKSEEVIKMLCHHGKEDRKSSMTNSLKGLEHRKGIACITGSSGIGKTELLLEYAYRFRQRYKMILWLGGESRFILQNYMKLMHQLGVDVSIENKFFSERNGPWSFEQIEEMAINKVKKELMRDFPYLLVIDNLEREKDWWDGRNIMDLLPRFIGASHVIISTRLPQVADIKPMRILYMSGAEAMALMKGRTSEVSLEETDALRVIEEKVGRLPLGLALVGAVLSEFSVNAPKLLDAINVMPYKKLTWSQGEDVALKRNPFLVQLLDFCFLKRENKSSKLAMRILEASVLFAPTSVPISMLALAARESSREHHGLQLWRKCRLEATSCFMTGSSPQSLDVEALNFLLKLQIGRMTTTSLCISFHDVFKLYACKRGNGGVADFVVRAVSIGGSLPQSVDHIWAACFLLFKFGSDPVAVHLPIHDLVSFIERFVLPLCVHCFKALFRCNAALTLLRIATETLESLEDSFLADANSRQNKSSCFSSCLEPTMFPDPAIYQKFAHMRATLLETRAELMLRGNLYEIGERLCRRAVSIKEVIYGWEHHETISSRETLERFLRFQSFWN